MNDPLVSVITVVFNSRDTLETTIKSVLCQERSIFEYWIIDGGSTDGSVNIILKYESQLAGWISESDKGIYDAMNKGISKANGKWLYFLGADDCLEQNVLLKMKHFLTPDMMLVYGDVLFNNGVIYQSSLGLRTILQNTVHHQGAFYNKDLFKNFRYKTELKILSDYELNLYVYLSKFNSRKVSLIVASCVQGGASSQISLSTKETNIVRAGFVKNVFRNWILSNLLKVYNTQKRIRASLFNQLH